MILKEDLKIKKTSENYKLLYNKNVKIIQQKEKYYERI